MKVTPPDSHHLRAATGWLELGNPSEALDELNRIQPPFRTLHVVLELEWAIHAAAGNWAAAHHAANLDVQLHPTEIACWIHRAYAARRKPGGGLPAAFADLLPAVQKFPDDDLVRYNLACYTAQLGQIDTAWRWLEEAIHRSSLEKIRKMALADEDLRLLWDKLRARSENRRPDA